MENFAKYEAVPAAFRHMVGAIWCATLAGLSADEKPRLRELPCLGVRAASRAAGNAPGEGDLPEFSPSC